MAGSFFVKFYIKYTLIIWICLFGCAFSQDEIEDLEIDNILLNEVVLESDHSYAHSRSYLLLKKRVLKVYPYVDSIVGKFWSVLINLNFSNQFCFCCNGLRQAGFNRC